MGSSGDRLCQTSPIPRSPDGDKKGVKGGFRGRKMLKEDLGGETGDERGY